MEEVRVEKLAEKVTVYNHEVEDLHVYYVAGVLVHNKCGGTIENGDELFLPDEYYENLNKNVQYGYQAPNTKEIYKRLGNTSHQVETSVFISDEFGRIIYRIDYSTHGNELAHTNPHIHEFVGSVTKGQYSISERKYFLDEVSKRMRLGVANNNGEYNWFD